MGKWAAMILLVLALAWPAGADILETRQGERLYGRFVSGDRESLLFERRGKTERYPTSQVKGLWFQAGEQGGRAAPLPRANGPSPGPASAKPPRQGAKAASPASAAPPAGAKGAVTLPAGREITVATGQPLSTKLSKKGYRFYCRSAQELSQDGQVVVPAGNGFFGVVETVRRAGSPKGPLLELRLLGLASGGRVLPMESKVLAVTQKDERSGGVLVPAGEKLIFILRKSLTLFPIKKAARPPNRAQRGSGLLRGRTAGAVAPAARSAPALPPGAKRQLKPLVLPPAK